MLRDGLERLREFFSDGAASEPEDEKRFVPSLLDRSVMFAHGSGGSDLDQEVTAVAERAWELEETGRK